jgi:hypothetical protein
MMSDSQEQLVRYLRGELSAEEEEALERRYFADDELFEEMVASDIDLMDAYSQEELTPEEKHRYEQLTSSSGRRSGRIEFSRALQRLPESPGAGGLAPVPADRRPAEGRLAGGPAVSRFPQWWAAAAVLVAVAAGTWLAISSLKLENIRSEGEAERAGLRRRIQQLESQVADQRTRIEQLSRDLEAQRRQTPQTTPEPVRQASARKRVSFELIAGVLRDPTEATELVIPKDAETVLLRLGLESADYGRYRAVLERAGGASISQQAGLKAQGKGGTPTVILKVPSSLLGPGDYFVRLSGSTTQGSYEPAGEYSFRVVKR